MIIAGLSSDEIVHNFTNFTAFARVLNLLRSSITLCCIRLSVWLVLQQFALYLQAIVWYLVSSCSSLIDGSGFHILDNLTQNIDGPMVLPLEEG